MDEGVWKAAGREPRYLVEDPRFRRWFLVLGIAGPILGAVVLPNLMQPTCRGGNRTAAVATLRNLASVQAQMRTAGRVDLDGDGLPEYGTFGEMTGAAGVRTDAEGRSRGAAISPPLLSPALAWVDENGIVTKSGYAFRIFLPARGGGEAREGRAPREIRHSGGAG